MTKPQGQERVVPFQVAWWWFSAWLVVGAGYSVAVLGALTVGPLVLLIPLLVTVALVLYKPARTGAPGLVSGLSLPVFYVAYLNRGGPGMVCKQTANGGGCTEEWSPWPFLAVALCLLVAGLLIMHTRARSARRRVAVDTGPNPT